MTTLTRSKHVELTGNPAAWLPVVVLPVAAAWLTATSVAWVQMWAIAFAIYAGCKWLTFATSPLARQASLAKSAGYLFLWTGMDADAFFDARRRPASPRRSELVWSIGQAVVGSLLLLLVAPRLAPAHPLIAGWLTMTGLVSILHFGLAHWLSIAGRANGVEARYIMHKPLFAASLADFWGRRWNLAFRDLMHQFVFLPLAPAVGTAWATVGAFLVSGLIHDAVISFSAGGGYGLPTLYFLIQAAGTLLEHSRFGRRLGLGRGWLGRIFGILVVLLPAGLLFHSPFIDRVVLPMLQVVGTLRVPSDLLAIDFSHLIFLGGILHFGILLASALTPRVLDWRHELAQLTPLSRQLVWVHGAFIVLVIVGFGLLSVILPGELAAGGWLARGVCAFIALFWLARLGVQFFVFDPKPYLQTTFLKLGYHALTAIFLYHAVVYSIAALL